MSKGYGLLCAISDSGLIQRFGPSDHGGLQKKPAVLTATMPLRRRSASNLRQATQPRQCPLFSGHHSTYRNCSSSVAYALEASLDGVLAARSQHWRGSLRTLLMPELWVAAQVRKRAMTMAWTPGLLMDYAAALKAIVHPRRNVRSPRGR